MSRTLSNSELNLLLTPWGSDEGQRGYYRQVGQYDYDYTDKLEARYPSVSIPLFIMWGEEDQWVDISEGKRLSTLVPGATLKALPDAGHFSMLDVPNLFNQTLKSWLTAQTR